MISVDLKKNFSSILIISDVKPLRTVTNVFVSPSPISQILNTDHKEKAGLALSGAYRAGKKGQ